MTTPADPDSRTVPRDNGVRPGDISLFNAMESEVRLYSRTFPTVFHRAKGAELYAENGRLFLDFFCGAGALNYGHNHPQVKRRLLEYLDDDRVTHCLDMHATAKRDFLTRLRDVVLRPRELDHKVQFCGPTGTDAVEAALKIARKATGRDGVVAFCGAFHGMSRGSLAVTGSRRARAAGRLNGEEVMFVPYEDGPHGPFDSIGYLRRMFTDPSSGVDVPAAVIVESAQIEGGIHVASAQWLQRLRTLTEAHGVLLICDEIQTGCGRTGRFFGFEHAAIVPDIVTVSKSLSGYGLPLSIVLVRPHLDVLRPGEHTGTFRGNQLALVTATAALDIWTQEHFRTGLAVACGRLRRFATEVADVDTVRSVRGVGAVYGIDTGDPAVAKRVQRQCFDDGLIVELCGRGDTVVKVMPPLTIDPARLDRGLDVLHEALAVAAPNP